MVVAVDMTLVVVAAQEVIKNLPLRPYPPQLITPSQSVAVALGQQELVRLGQVGQIQHFHPQPQLAVVAVELVRVV